jgi:hypothetical protein
MPSEFPFPSVNSAYPIPLFYEAQMETFVVGRTIYDDNGADTKKQAGGTGMKSWIVRYDGLTTTQAAILDAWVLSMCYSPDEGSAFGANFREHIFGEAWTSTSGTLYANVHIAPGGYRKNHVGVDIQAREFLLEKRP